MAEGEVVMADDANHDREEQQRQLEEIRRSFREIGIKVGSFEPAQPNGTSTDRAALPAPPAAAQPPAARSRPGWLLALLGVGVVVCLLVGGGLGYLLHRPAATTLQPTASSIVTRPAPPPPPRVVAPPACLQTAQRGDELIVLFTGNVRDRRLDSALKAYTLASQACRKEASP
jgi:hypothetical protein